MKKRPPCPAFGVRPLAPSELALLRLLDAADHPLTMPEIQAEASGRVTDELLWLLEAGLVTRGTMAAPCASPGRPPAFYFPTTAGVQLVRQLEVPA